MHIKRIFSFLLLGLAVSLPLAAQFTEEQLAERGKWEEFLASANIVKQEQMSGSLAVTNPWVLTLEDEGGISRQALWKNPKGRMKGYLEGWRWEIAAYRLDKYLGLNMIPPTIERRFNGNLGSIQLWVLAEMDLRKKTKDNIKTPSYKVYYWNRATYLQRAFDSLIANEDRHMGNVLITDDWKMILIDHSRSFRTSKKFTKKLMFGKNGIKGKKLILQLPRNFLEKLRSLTPEIVKGVVDEYLTDKEIETMLVRRDMLLEEIEATIKEKGEDKVLY